MCGISKTDDLEFKCRSKLGIALRVLNEHSIDFEDVGYTLCVIRFNNKEQFKIAQNHLKRHNIKFDKVERL